MGHYDPPGHLAAGPSHQFQQHHHHHREMQQHSYGHSGLGGGCPPQPGAYGGPQHHQLCGHGQHGHGIGHSLHSGGGGGYGDQGDYVGGAGCGEFGANQATIYQNEVQFCGRVDQGYDSGHSVCSGYNGISDSGGGYGVGGYVGQAGMVGGGAGQNHLLSLQQHTCACNDLYFNDNVSELSIDMPTSTRSDSTVPHSVLYKNSSDYTMSDYTYNH